MRKRAPLRRIVGNVSRPAATKTNSVITRWSFVHRFCRASACLCMQSAILLWQLRPSVRPSARTVWPRVTKFGTITHMERERAYWGSAAPFLEGRWPSVPKFLGPLGLTYSDQTCYENACVRSVFLGVSHAPFKGGGVAPKSLKLLGPYLRSNYLIQRPNLMQ